MEKVKIKLTNKHGRGKVRNYRPAAAALILKYGLGVKVEDEKIESKPEVEKPKAETKKKSTPKKSK